MTKKLSLIACGVILSSTVVFADSTIKKAFEAGKVSGDLSVYGTTTDNKTGLNAGYTAGTVGLAFETATYMNLSAKLGFRASHEFAEQEDGDYDGDFADNSIMNEAAIKYSRDNFSLTLGRQAIDLEWIGDYNEAAVLEVTATENTTITAGYADRQGVADPDGISAFEDKNTKEKGIYFADVKVETSGLTVNPYFYSLPNLADIYGIKASFGTDMFGISGQYAATSEDTMTDGNISQVELSANIESISLAAGFITTDSTGGIASMSTYGDNIDPTENIGDYVYGTDAETYYGSVSTEISGVELGVLYAKAQDNADSFKELTFSANYSFNDELSAGLIISDVSDENNSANDYTNANLTLTYAF